MMKKLCILFLFVTLMLGILAGCANNEKTTTKKIVDCSGTEVEIPTKIEKMVVTSPSAVAFMSAMNLEDKLVGTHGSIYTILGLMSSMRALMIWLCLERIQMPRN